MLSELSKEVFDGTGKMFLDLKASWRLLVSTLRPVRVGTRTAAALQRFRQVLCEEINAIRHATPYERRGALEMPHAMGLESHQTRTGEVGDRMAMRSMQRPFTFYRDRCPSRDRISHYCRSCGISSAKTACLAVFSVQWIPGAQSARVCRTARG